MATIINLKDLVNGTKHENHEAPTQTALALIDEPNEQEAMKGLDEEIAAHVAAILHLDGLNIEICGRWVWVSGDTKPRRAELKSAGYRWASKKKVWYYRKAEDARRYKGKGKEMEEIRAKYGSMKLN